MTMRRRQKKILRSRRKGRRKKQTDEAGISSTYGALTSLLNFICTPSYPRSHFLTLTFTFESHHYFLITVAFYLHYYFQLIPSLFILLFVSPHLFSSPPHPRHLLAQRYLSPAQSSPVPCHPSSDLTRPLRCLWQDV